MNIYLCSSYTRMVEMRGYADALAEMGHTITSSWVYNADDPGAALSPEDHGEHEDAAMKGLAEINRSDVVICFTEGPGSRLSRGGRHVEMGYAIARKIEILVIGYRENLFCYLPQIHFAEDFRSAGWVLAAIIERHITNDED